jgi:hypothetical protein
MTQAVSRRPLTAEDRVRSRVSPCGICGGQRGTGTDFSPITSVFPCPFHSTGAPLQGKTKTLIFITGSHNKPQGCGASVASAAGPFATQKKEINVNPWHAYAGTEWRRGYNCNPFATSAKRPCIVSTKPRTLYPRKRPTSNLREY